MRKSVLLLLIALSVGLLGVGVIMLVRDEPLAPPTQVTAANAKEVARISVQDLHAQLQGAKPPLVLEIRSAEAYAGQHIPGSRRADLDQVASLAGGLDRKQPIITLCT